MRRGPIVLSMVIIKIRSCILITRPLRHFFRAPTNRTERREKRRLQKGNRGQDRQRRDEIDDEASSGLYSVIFRRVFPLGSRVTLERERKREREGERGGERERERERRRNTGKERSIGSRASKRDVSCFALGASLKPRVSCYGTSWHRLRCHETTRCSPM